MLSQLQWHAATRAPMPGEAESTERTRRTISPTLTSTRLDGACAGHTHTQTQT